MINTFFPPWRGGAETYVYNLAKQLVKLGHEVNVFCAHPPKSPGLSKMNGINVYRLYAPFWIYAVPITPKLFFKLIKAEADIIHANFPNPYNAFIASLKTFFQKTPSVLTWHNDLPPVSKASNMLIFIHDNLLAPIYLRWFDRIIATSKRYLKFSKLLSKYQDKVIVVPNGVDCEKFNPSIEGNCIKAYYGLEGFKIVLFVGALTKWHRYKGLDILIKAFKLVSKEYRNVRLLIVGDGHLKPEYQKQCISLGLADKVIFAGNVPDKELPKFYAASDMLILPSKDWSEGFGLTILEANASGKPAIGSNVGGIPSIITHGINGLLVPPCDEKALANSILNLLNDEELAKKMGKEGRKIAEAHDWKRIAKLVEKIYFQISK